MTVISLTFLVLAQGGDAAITFARLQDQHGNAYMLSLWEGLSVHKRLTCIVYGPFTYAKHALANGVNLALHLKISYIGPLVQVALWH